MTRLHAVGNALSIVFDFVAGAFISTRALTFWIYEAYRLSWARGPLFPSVAGDDGFRGMHFFVLVEELVKQHVVDLFVVAVYGSPFLPCVTSWVASLGARPDKRKAATS
jgi:hypothetical protein